MAAYGKVEELNSEQSWDVYVERLSFYYEANKITEGGTKRAILLSVVGAKTNAVIRSLCAPRKPGEVDFEEIVEIV